MIRCMVVTSLVVFRAVVTNRVGVRAVTGLVGAAPNFIVAALGPSFMFRFAVTDSDYDGPSAVNPCTLGTLDYQ